tara:strand:+ start:49907 stop:50797 length:891 start_codon:yes stop_codon:yes gene_type:complete
MTEFYSHGKLLITGEYTVLDGSISLAVPTKFGQSLTVSPISKNEIVWKSFDINKKLWFETNFSTLNMDQICKNKIHDSLINSFKIIKDLKPELFKKNGFEFNTFLDFPQNWGLGSSSTLINNLAQWAGVDPFQLLEKTFGGSGYDIACAQSSRPIIYQKINGKVKIQPISFNPSFKEKIFFVYRNKKQNTREAISHYKSLRKIKKKDISKINTITKTIILTSKIKEFENLIGEHEMIISKLIKQPPLKKIKFSDYDGAIKSLGAWGGDFFLATGSDQEYFKKKGYETIISYKDIIL